MTEGRPAYFSGKCLHISMSALVTSEQKLHLSLLSASLDPL